MARKLEEDASVNLGFQIAPMIDVVFVIMLYFMALAATVKVEQEIKTKLPGTVGVSVSTDEPPEEATIGIDAEGLVTLNDDEMDRATDPKCTNLTNSLKLLQQATAAQKSKLLITIVSDELAKYGRVVNVLNALTNAKIENVTFTVGESEG